jgi:hypothetical protein
MQELTGNPEPFIELRHRLERDRHHGVLFEVAWAKATEAVLGELFPQAERAATARALEATASTWRSAYERTSEPPRGNGRVALLIASR